MSLRVVDVFPKEPSDKPLTRLTSYPERNFARKTLSAGEQMHIFVCFMDRENRVCYSKRHPSHKTDSAVYRIGMGCRIFDKGPFDPIEIDFRRVKQRLRKNPAEDDTTRMGFKIENRYLVKSHFTSGIRTVERGTAHVVQTLSVPILLYLKPRPPPTTVAGSNKYFRSDDEKRFPHERLQHKYKLSILPPYTANRIPPDTRYVLLTVQKTYFAFDVVPENYQIPFKYRDPVRHRITELPGWGDDYSEPLDLSSSKTGETASEIITLEEEEEEEEEEE